MTTLYSVLIAVGVLATCGPLSMYFGDKAGVPDYGTNPDQKPGWTILYVLTLFPAALAFGYLTVLAFLAVTGL